MEYLFRSLQWKKTEDSRKVLNAEIQARPPGRVRLQTPKRDEYVERCQSKKQAKTPRHQATTPTPYQADQNAASDRFFLLFAWLFQLGYVGTMGKGSGSRCEARADPVITQQSKQIPVPGGFQSPHPPHHHEVAARHGIRTAAQTQQQTGRGLHTRRVLRREYGLLHLAVVPASFVGGGSANPQSLFFESPHLCFFLSRVLLIQTRLIR